MDFGSAQQEPVAPGTSVRIGVVKKPDPGRPIWSGYSISSNSRDVVRVDTDPGRRLGDRDP